MVEMEKHKSKSKNSAALSEEELMWAVGFTPVDVAANQDGVLSDDQLQNFRDQRRKAASAVVLMVLLAVGALALGQNLRSAVDGICLLIPSIVFLVIGASAFLEARTCHRDIRANQVDAVQGRVQLDIASKGKNVTYVIVLQHRVWSVKKQVFFAFKNGDPYVIYFTPRSNKILSAEWLRED